MSTSEPEESGTEGQTEPAPPPTPEVDPIVVEPDRPIVRVIWHGTYGSTYQRYYRPGQRRSLNSHPGPRGRSKGDGGESDIGPNLMGGGSMFSRPLTCPNCQESLELHQPDEELPDRLLGTCFHCQTWALLFVGDEGRITLIKLSQLPTPMTPSRQSVIEEQWDQPDDEG